jgi:CPA2 family monovalent cation:H+ antiporter-2
MPHSVNLITTIAAGLGLAFCLGFVAVRLKLPALVGYLVAGIIIGPATPGFVADVGLAQQLAEVGVMLLMFGVGLHFSLDDLLAVRKIALPGAIVQMVVATLLGTAVGLHWGWSVGGAVVFGLALSVASTVVLLRALEDLGELESDNGRIAIGWLVVEDLAMVLVLVLLPPLAGTLGGNSASVGLASLLATIGVTLAKVAAFVVLMLVVGKRVSPWLLNAVARTGSRELFTLCVIASAVGVAFASAALFGVSFALGAFFAGMVMRESPLAKRAAEESLPLRDAFSVLFFVSVGMLFDPQILLREPLSVLAVVAIIVLGKSLAAFAIVLAFRYPLNTALTVSASLAQIGEFSFILVSLGGSLGLLPIGGQQLILGAALISITINPLVFKAIKPLQALIGSRSRLTQALQSPEVRAAHLPADVAPAAVSGHVLLVGHGVLGRRIGAALHTAGVRYVVIEQKREPVEKLRKRGVVAICGDATTTATLSEAKVEKARVLVLTIPDPLHARQIIAIARKANPGIEVVAYTSGPKEAALLRREEAVAVFSRTNEVARAMTRKILDPKAAKTDVEQPEKA